MRNRRTTKNIYIYICIYDFGKFHISLSSSVLCHWLFRSVVFNFSSYLSICSNIACDTVSRNSTKLAWIVCYPGDLYCVEEKCSNINMHRIFSYFISISISWLCRYLPCTIKVTKCILLLFKNCAIIVRISEWSAPCVYAKEGKMMSHLNAEWYRSFIIISIYASLFSIQKSGKVYTYIIIHAE